MSRFPERGGALRFLMAHKFAALAFIVLAIGLLLVIAPRAPREEGIGDSVLMAASSVLKILAKPVEAMRAWGDTTEYLATTAELEVLRAEMEELQTWRERAIAAEAKVGKYEELLKLEPTAGANFITARVFGDLGGAFTRNLIVDAGTREGVQVGQAALGARGFVGHIIASGARASRILLVTDVNSHIAVVVGTGAARAVMSGDGTASPFLEFLDERAELGEGAAIATSGHDGYIPAGLPVGELRREGVRWRVALWEKPQALEHVRIAELPQILSPAYQTLPLQLSPQQ